MATGFANAFLGHGLPRDDLFGLARSVQNEGGGAQRDDVAVADEGTLLVAQQGIVQKGARVRGSIAQHKLGGAVRLRGGGDDAVCGVDAGVNRLDGCVGFGAFHQAAYDVLAGVQRYFLLEVEGVFKYGEVTQHRVLLLFVGRGSGLFVGGLGLWHAQPELLVALGTFEHQYAAGFELRFIEQDALVALWAAYLLHNGTKEGVGKKERRVSQGARAVVLYWCTMKTK